MLLLLLLRHYYTITITSIGAWLNAAYFYFLSYLLLEQIE